jgi:thioredoxin-dependent peroxiredoxin
MQHEIRSFTYGFLLSACFLEGTAFGQGANLQVGALAPEFQCLDDMGKIWDSRDHVGKRIIVLYFYPSDFSHCCTQQAERYQDCQYKLAERCIDAEVLGISGDTVLAHRLFKTTHRLNQPLLSDTYGDVARKFGVPVRSGDGGKSMLKDERGVQVLDENGRALSLPRAVTTGRSTFVIGMDGRILYCETKVAPKNDSQDVITFFAR